MSRAALSAVDVQSLFAELRATGKFAVDTRHYLMAYQLIDANERASQEDKVTHWDRVLGPIVCRNAKEQKEFQRYFRQWHRFQHQQPLSENDASLGAHASALPDAPQKNKSNNSVLTRYLLLSFIVLLIALSVFINWPEINQSDTPVSPVQSNKPPEQEQNLSELGQSVKRYLPYIVTLGIAVWGGVTLYHRRRYQAYMRQGVLQSNFSLSQLAIERYLKRLYRDNQSRETFRKFRRHSVMETRELDAARTATLASQRVGYTQPQYLQRKISPEYLVLIDADSSGNHITELFKQFTEGLSLDGAIVDYFYYFSDPRLCYDQRNKANGISLKAIASQYQQARLLVLGNGDGLIQTRTGRCKAWVEKVFRPWSCRTLITPKVSPPWGATESALMSLSFMVVPCSKAGLGSLGNVLENLSLPEGEHVPVSKNTAAPPYYFPVMLTQNKYRWLFNQAAPPEDTNELIIQLKQYLGSKGYEWLCSCAIFPALSWDLTCYLGSWHASMSLDSGVDEDTFFRLANLPWFAQGYMPDYLRIRLQADLQPGVAESFAQGLEVLLYKAMARPDTNKTLEYGVPLDPEQRDFLYEKLDEFDDDNALRDGLLLSFLNGQLPAPGDFRLPDKVAQLSAKKRRKSRSPIYSLAVMAGVLGLTFILVQYGLRYLTQFSAGVNRFVEDELFRLLLYPAGLLYVVIGLVYLLLRWSRAVMGRQQDLALFDTRFGIGRWRFASSSVYQIGLAIIPVAFLCLFFIANLSLQVEPAYSYQPAIQQQSPAIAERLVQEQDITKNIETDTDVLNCIRLLVALLIFNLILPLHNPRRLQQIRCHQPSLLNVFNIAQVLRIGSWLRMWFSVALSILTWVAVKEYFNPTFYMDYGVMAQLWSQAWNGFGLYWTMAAVLLLLNMGNLSPGLRPHSLALKLGVGYVAASSVTIVMGSTLMTLLRIPINYVSDAFRLTELSFDPATTFVEPLVAAPLSWGLLLVLALLVVVHLHACGLSPVSALLKNRRSLYFILVLYTLLYLLCAILATNDAFISLPHTGQNFWLFVAAVITTVLMGSEAVNSASWPRILFRYSLVHSLLVFTLYYLIAYAFMSVAKYDGSSVLAGQVGAESAYYLAAATYAMIAIRGWLKPLVVVTVKQTLPISHLGFQHYALLLVIGTSLYFDSLTLSFSVFLLWLLPYWSNKGMVVSRLNLTALVFISFFGFGLNLDLVSMGWEFTCFYLIVSLFIYALIYKPEFLAGLLLQQKSGEAPLLLLCVFLPLSPVVALNSTDSLAIYLGVNSGELLVFSLILLGLTSAKSAYSFVVLSTLIALLWFKGALGQTTIEIGDFVSVYFTDFPTEMWQLIYLIGLSWFTGLTLHGLLLEQVKMGLQPKVMFSIWFILVMGILAFEPLLMEFSQDDETARDGIYNLSGALLMFAFFIIPFLLKPLPAAGLLFGLAAGILARALFSEHEFWHWEAFFLPFAAFAMLGFRLNKDNVVKGHPLYGWIHAEQDAQSKKSRSFERQAPNSPLSCLNDFRIPIRFLSCVSVAIFLWAMAQT